MEEKKVKEKSKNYGLICDITKFIDSDEKTLDFETMYPISDIREVLKYLKYDMDRDYDTNGYRHDFWIKFKKGSETLMLVGSWFYGNYKLTKN